MKKVLFLIIFISCTQHNLDNPYDTDNLDYSAPYLTIESGEKSVIRLKWENNKRVAAGYHIYRGLTKDSLEKIIEVEKDMTVFEDRDSSLKTGKKYFYAIEALLAGNEFSQRSEVVEGYIGFYSSSVIAYPLENSQNGQSYTLCLDNKERILTSGSIRSGEKRNVLVWRLTPEGQPDISFGGCGYARLPYEGASYGMIYDNYGKIWICGCLDSSDNNLNAFIARLNEDGSPDSSFQNSGIMYLKNEGRDFFKDIAIDRNGKIVVTGSCFNGMDKDMVIRRYNYDGSPDTTFNGNGFVLDHNAAGGDGDDVGHAVFIDPDGHIVVAGESAPPGEGLYDAKPHTMALWRYLDNGAPDTNFGDGGVKTVNFYYEENLNYFLLDHYAFDVFVDTEGRITTSGYTKFGASIPVILRFTRDGQVDTGFNDGTGYFAYHEAGTFFSLTGDLEGNIYAAGTKYTSPDAQSLLLKLLPDGRPDINFGESGSICRNTVEGGEDIYKVLYDGRKNIFCTGYRFSGQGSEPFLLKYDSH